MHPHFRGGFVLFHSNKVISLSDIYTQLKRKHHRTLCRIFARPTSSSVSWADAMALMSVLGATIDEKRSGSRVLVIWCGERRVLHKPHPGRNLDKATVKELKIWLLEKGIHP